MDNIRARDFQTRPRAGTVQTPAVQYAAPTPSRRHSFAPQPHASIGSPTGATGRELPTDNRASIDTLRRRPERSNTVRNYSAVTANTPTHYEEPGAEPGIDPSNDVPDSRFVHLQADCDITVVDFSEDNYVPHELDNTGLKEFLTHPKEEWVSCRWINVNGLSWDVIKTLGHEKNLHRLAIEDLMHTRGRTKADWYSDHAFSK